MARDKKERDVRRKVSQIIDMVLDTGKEKGMTCTQIRSEAVEVLQEFACEEKIKIPMWRINKYTGNVFARGNESVPTPKMFEDYQRNANTFAYTLIAEEFPIEPKLERRG